MSNLRKAATLGAATLAEASGAATLAEASGVATPTDPSGNQIDFAKMDGPVVLEWAERARAAGLIRVSHGDAGHWLRRGYQNESLLFWHRELGFLFPSRIASDAGEVPPCFRVGNGPDDFAPDHWAEAVDGSAVFVSDTIVADLREQLRRAPAARPAVVIRGRSHPVVGLTPAHLDEPYVWFDACTGLCPCGELRRQ
jgi:hypothetical protein